MIKLTKPSSLSRPQRLLLINAISEDLENRSEKVDIFQLWEMFSMQVQDRPAASAADFIEIAKPYLSGSLWKSLYDLIADEDFNAYSYFANFQVN